jgi:hypothetical protein
MRQSIVAGEHVVEQSCLPHGSPETERGREGLTEGGRERQREREREREKEREANSNLRETQMSLGRNQT